MGPRSCHPAQPSSYRGPPPCQYSPGPHFPSSGWQPRESSPTPEGPRHGSHGVPATHLKDHRPHFSARLAAKGATPNLQSRRPCSQIQSVDHRALSIAGGPDLCTLPGLATPRTPLTIGGVQGPAVWPSPTVAMAPTPTGLFWGPALHQAWWLLSPSPPGEPEALRAGSTWQLPGTLTLTESRSPTPWLSPLLVVALPPAWGGLGPTSWLTLAATGSPPIARESKGFTPLLHLAAIGTLTLTRSTRLCLLTRPSSPCGPAAYLEDSELCPLARPDHCGCPPLPGGPGALTSGSALWPHRPSSLMVGPGF